MCVFILPVVYGMILWRVRVMKTSLLSGAMVLFLLCSAASADLSSVFDGYTTVEEIGVSGLQSSYYGPTKAGDTLPGYMQTLGPDRVKYPHGIGEVPSPGGSVGRNFDQGVMGIKRAGGSLKVRLAGALNPLNGYYYSGWKTWYGQGDVFITVEDTTGVSHFALLNSWARDASGDYRVLNGGYFDAAQAFHTGGGSGPDLQGHLVSLPDTDDVLRTGGTGSYHPDYSSGGLPRGLDYRVYARGGTDAGDAALAHSSVYDYSRQWFIQTWTLPTNWLTSERVYTLGLHTAASCSNDQIGMVSVVPVPGAFLLGLAGFGTYGFVGRIARNRRRKG